MKKIHLKKIDTMQLFSTRALLLFAILLYSCNNEKQSRVLTADTLQPDIKKIDTPHIEQGPAAHDPILKDIDIDQKYFDQQVAAHRVISKTSFDTLSLETISMLKEFRNDTAVKIKIIDTLLANSRMKLLVVAAKTENESWAWLVCYSANNEIIWTENIYYEDFVEYFSKTTTRIKSKTIAITTETEMEDSRVHNVKKYVIGDGGKLLLLK